MRRAAEREREGAEARTRERYALLLVLQAATLLFLLLLAVCHEFVTDERRPTLERWIWWVVRVALALCLLGVLERLVYAASLFCDLAHEARNEGLTLERALLLLTFLLVLPLLTLLAFYAVLQWGARDVARLAVIERSISCHLWVFVGVLVSAALVTLHGLWAGRRQAAIPPPTTVDAVRGAQHGKKSWFRRGS